MNISTKLLKAAAGSAGGGATTDVTDVFSTFLYEGNGAAQKIENGIQLGAASTDNVALHMTGATSTDNGPLSLTVNAIGNATTSTTQTKFTSKSLYVDGTGSGDSTTCFDIQEGQIKLAKKDFTIEYWVYYNSHNSYGDLGSWNYYVSGYNGNFRMGIGGSGTNINIFAYDAQSFLGSVSGTVSVSTGTWYHVAISRSNGTAYLFLDGTLKASGAFDHNLTDAEIGGITLGKIGAYEQVDAYFSDFRITVGAARYTSSFTAPSAALPVDSGTSGEGGLVWTKERTGTQDHTLFDTERGTNRINSNNTSAQFGDPDGLRSFHSNGYTIKDGGDVNASGDKYVSWTFRKAPKFFDVVTYSGSSSAQTIAHNLGVTPAMIIVKQLNSSGRWTVYHKDASPTGNPENGRVALNTTDQWYEYPSISSFANLWNQTAPTSTHFTVGTDATTGASGSTYVAYLFAHNNNDGEFGPDSDQDIIKCDKYTGGTTGTEVNVGFEPQFVMIKRTTGSGDWMVFDAMRGVVSDPYPNLDNTLFWNLSNAERTNTGYIGFTPTGFIHQGGSGDTNTNGNTYVYMAIRRGPLAAPTSASDVFASDTKNSTGDGKTPLYRSSFPVDMALLLDTDGGSDFPQVHPRLRTTKYVRTNNSAVEQSGTSFTHDFMNGFRTDTSFTADTTRVCHMWKRALGYFDIVTYNGNAQSSAITVNHNLGVVPEMMWCKKLNATGDWMVYHKGLNGGTNPHTYRLRLNSSGAEGTGSGVWNAAPTATQFSVGTDLDVNADTNIVFITYLFATVAGVSKVGSYTGNAGASTINVDCGFSSGARFVLIKESSGTGDWWVFDTVRGLVAGNDAALKLNTTDAESSFDYIDPYSGGFSLQTNSGINTNGATFIFYAIA